MQAALSRFKLTDQRLNQRLMQRPLRLLTSVVDFFLAQTLPRDF
jgi:hypothetical protein